jgi:hypothetical protein
MRTCSLVTAAGLLLLGLAPGACTLIFGDYEVRGTGGHGASTGGAGGGTSSSSAASTSTSTSTGGAGGQSTSTGGTGGATSSSSSASTSSGTAHCVNGVQDGGETDIDCGGPCAPCVPGAACLVDGDCLTAHCVDDGPGKKVCCQQACSGPCMSCNQGNVSAALVGKCAPVRDGDQGGCPAGQGCNLQGLCAQGAVDDAPCTTNAQCASAYCYTPLQMCHPHNEPPGWPCMNGFNCASASCDTNTALCQ